MQVDAGWDTVTLYWNRDTGRLDAFVGRHDPETKRTAGHHGRFHGVRTTADVVSVVGEVLSSEQLQLPT